VTSLDTPTAPAGAESAPEPPTPSEAHLETLFRRQAERTPDAAAVVWLHTAKRRGQERYGERGDTVGPWTYRRLDAAAGEVARRIAARGAGPGDRVALCLERSPWLVAAILGTLRAGATYVPLDPGYPRRRLAFMLEDSGATTLVTQPDLVKILPGDISDSLGDGLLTLDPESGFEDDAPEGEPSDAFPSVDDDHLSHLIYTSGSTGTPKGVAVRQGSSAAMVRWARETFTAAERAGVLAATSVCFDLSVFELFLPLTTGGTVLLARDALELTELAPGDLTDHPVTLINTVPTAITELLHADAVPATVTTVNLAGEALKRHLVERIYALGHVDKVYNLYGPSEDTTYSTWELVPRGEGLPVTIGRALPGGRATVLGNDLRPVADGEVGELCLAGDGLARGYFDRPARTAESFVPDADSNSDSGAPAGSRLYRTGDLARRMDDGRLEFLGRIDHQVKLRGFRIELGEIEEALLAHPAVRAAVAHVYDGGAESSDPTLVVYWSGSGGEDVPTAELETHLAASLPDYMVPGRWVHLDELPQTPTGKIDRKALPAPSQERPDVGIDYRQPETPTESFIADLWSELLAIERVGADDDLFALGGHSLIATRASVRIRTELGVTLPPEAPFLFPTVAALAGEVDRRREAGPDPADAVPEMPPAKRYPRDGHLPLGFPQSQIWIINQLRPENLAYNFQFTVRLHGPLDHGALEATLTEVVRRHEALRTTFPAVDGEPTQVIHEPWPVTVPLADLSGLEEVTKRREEERLIHKLVRRHFNVLELPLMVWPMLRLGAEEHLYFQVEQHFVHDGWSIGRMMFELEAIYPAILEGRPHPMPELPVQYADFAIWQREWMSGAALAHQLDYWRKILADTPGPLEIPTDRPRTPSQRFAGRRLDVDVPPELNAALREMGRKTGFTLFMLMTAAFEVLMYRYSGRQDFVIGTALANRRQKEFEPIIGMIVNTLVLRADVSNAEAGIAPTFMQVLDRVRTAALGLQAHQDIPFERLVEDLQPERDLSRNPIYQHMFSFHDAAVPDLRFGGLEGELVERHNGSAKTDLNVIVKPRASQRAGRAPTAEDDVLRVLWEYSVDLFDDTTARRQWHHYLTLLGAVVESPEAPVDRLPLMPAAERQQVLAGWNDPAARGAAAPRSAPGTRLETLFAAQVERTPDAVALAWPAGSADERSWTYRRLAGAAAAVAHRLAGRGLGPGDRVAICLSRTPRLVAAILGTLRAGATYVPLDPTYPALRLAFMLRDSAAAVVLSEEAVADVLPADGPPVVRLDGDGDGDSGEAGSEAAPPPLGAAPADGLSHLIYTSGSTGTPKGVAIRHAGAVAMLDWARHTYGRDERSGVLLSTSVCFDLSLFEIFLPLTTGGAAVLVRDALELTEVAADALAATPVTMLNTVPSAATELVRAGAVPPTVTTVNLAGEPLRRGLVEHLYGLGHVEHVYNLYGPSEDTTYSTWERVPRGDDLPVTIGVPLPGSRAYVTDRHLHPAPVGVPGELCLAGDGLARGYLERPGRTAAAFVPDPFTAEAGGGDDGDGDRGGRRLYRTGDLVRWRADGRLDFLGRIDHQVKLRGFRIELGEIEGALAAHPAVAEAVVTVHRGDGADPELLAYWTAALDDTDVESELESCLGERLPAYMVPRRWLHLDALPHTPSGKVDRAALPDPGRRDRAAADTAMVAPRNDTEVTLARVWAEVLGIDELGIDDGFFALGGHSLAGAKAVARSAAALGVDLTLPDLFEHPTVARFASLVARRRAVADATPAAARRAGTGRGPGASSPIPRADGDRHAGVHASFDQQRLWLIDRLIPRPATYHLGRAFRLQGDLHPGALAAALDALGRRHEVLRTTFAEGRAEDQPGSRDDADATPRTGGAGGAGGVLQRVTPITPGTPTLALPTIDLAALPAAAGEAETDRLLRQGVEHPFDLTADAPLRARLLNRGEGDRVLLLTLHHIATDGWSLPILYRDLAGLYRSALAGDAPELPALAVQYADFAAWQRRHLDGERRQELADFWHHRLDGAPEVLELPTDRPRPALRSMRGGRVSHHLDAATTGRLRRVAASRGATLFTALLAGWATLLGRLAGQRDVVVGSPVAGRGHADLEPLVGFFVNTLPLRLDLGAGGGGPGPGFHTLLERTRQTTLAAFDHQELPFERLVEAVAPDRDLAHSPLFQVTLAYQEGEEAHLQLAGTTSQPVPVERRESHYELTLFVQAADDGGLEWLLTFERDLFDDATVRRWAGYLERLLAAAADEPGRPLAELPLMSAEERRQVEAWAHGAGADAAAGAEATAAEGAEAVFLSVLAAAAERPRAPAVVTEGDGPSSTLTYGELERRSAALAHRLAAALDAGASERRVEGVVGVCLPPSPEMVVAVLASQRAGAAYLPLDPGHPPDRLAFTLEDSGAAVLVTSSELAAGPLAGFAGQTVLLDDGALPEGSDLETAETADTGRLDRPPASPDQLAYVIYTSGTTGRPKGTGLTHRGLARLVAWHRDTYGIGTDDRGALVASPAFDASVWELWPNLAAGAALCVPPPDLRLDPPALYRWLEREAVTVTFLPTPIYEALPFDDIADSGTRGDLRAVLVGGDRLNRAPRPGLPFRLVNHYGPTEDTVVTTAGEVPPAAPRGTGDALVLPPPIGRPIPGHRAHVLAPDLAPVPPGAAGELWVAGAGLARGYLGRPGLTADRFRPHPRPETSGERLYRTGDLARWLPPREVGAADDAGRLAFLGRRDDQVKLRGLRIELGEIESVLADRPEVRAAAVVVDDTGEARRLVAFVVPQDETLAVDGGLGGGDGNGTGEPFTARLAAALGDTLPGYMVPTAFALLPEVPLSPTGKVDRRELARRAADVASGDNGDRPPSGPAEALVAEVWCEVLGLSPQAVGAGSNFFALGGHSLLATRALAEIHRLSGVELPLRTLFQAPRLADLARQLAEAGFTARGDDHGAGDGEEPGGAGAGGGPGPIERLDRSAHRLGRRPGPSGEGDDAV